ncbi:uncharacterized protein LOC114540576 [Dendronephthya gigantea]|uniref:uncharacterized protein LOC114540576 n=1 Tax=Dendronephthya gigantea TaxID=151771 RepID=UPI00106A1A1B|nr:uncharacterized protein LOC114540576 [Dendronephthya gigantea]
MATLKVVPVIINNLSNSFYKGKVTLFSDGPKDPCEAARRCLAESTEGDGLNAGLSFDVRSYGCTRLRGIRNGRPDSNRNPSKRVEENEKFVDESRRSEESSQREMETRDLLNDADRTSDETIRGRQETEDETSSYYLRSNEKGSRRKRLARERIEVLGQKSCTEADASQSEPIAKVFKQLPYSLRSNKKAKETLPEGKETNVNDNHGYDVVGCHYSLKQLDEDLEKKFESEKYKQKMAPIIERLKSRIKEDANCGC